MMIFCYKSLFLQKLHFNNSSTQNISGINLPSSRMRANDKHVVFLPPTSLPPFFFFFLESDSATAYQYPCRKKKMEKILNELLGMGSHP